MFRMSRRQVMMQAMLAVASVTPGRARPDQAEVSVARLPLPALADLVPARAGDLPGDSFPLTSFINILAVRQFGNLDADATYIQRSAAIPHAEAYIPSYMAWNMWPEGWEAFAGFPPADVHAALAQPQAPGGFQLFMGAFDREGLVRTWEANGFKPDPVMPNTWAFGGSDDDWYALLASIDLDPFMSGAARGLALPYANVVAVGDPGLLARSVAVARREEPAMMAVGAPEVLLRSNTASFGEAIIAPGERFLTTGFATHPNLTADQREDARVLESGLRDDYGPTPVVSGVVLAASPGMPYRPATVEGLPAEPASYVALVALEDNAAGPTFLNMATTRFERYVNLTRRVPFTDLLEMTDAIVEPDGVVRFEFRQVGEARLDLIDLFGARDLFFLQHEAGR